MQLEWEREPPHQTESVRPGTLPSPWSSNLNLGFGRGVPDEIHRRPDAILAELPRPESVGDSFVATDRFVCSSPHTMEACQSGAPLEAQRGHTSDFMIAGSLEGGRPRPTTAAFGFLLGRVATLQACRRPRFPG